MLFGRSSIWAAAARVHVIGEERDDFVSNSMLFQVFPLAVHDLSNMYKKDE